MSARLGLGVLSIVLAVAGVACLIASAVQHSGPVDRSGPPLGYTVAWFGVGLLAFALLGLMLALVVAAIVSERRAPITTKPVGGVYERRAAKS